MWQGGKKKHTHKLTNSHLLTTPEIKQEVQKLKRSACHFLFEEASPIPSLPSSTAEGRCVYLSNNNPDLVLPTELLSSCRRTFLSCEFPCSFPLLRCELVTVGKLETVASSLIQL